MKTLQDDLLKAEQRLREANERELPEEKLRFMVKQKRKAFNDLMTRFKKENDEIGNRRFERRRRREYNQNEPGAKFPMGDSYDDYEDPFASFHRRDRRPHQKNGFH